ncbi:DUF4303 domain-containing protein [Fulvivirga sp. 29W222]|uniref:DUF4303 domain-containing protein n=1 Tax=Fulvivirga marina TaxID=2494733 RepID=A0A937KD53_9BACT|nr:DUF4303 domain-containing protein [Fulvivirga marina]MBL6448247.1 DUF4303 domain-containing protein [Fulvivirga marina]
MNSEQLNTELQKLLYKALTDYLSVKLNELQNEKVYAVAVYCDSGCRSMGGAISTVESLNRKSKNASIDSQMTYEIDASAWEYVNEHYELFDEVNHFIDRAYNEFYEGEFEDVDLEVLDDEQLWEFIAAFFSKAIVETMNKLKEEGAFNDELFTENLFLGMQFGDPGKEDLEMLKRVSVEINSSYWHNKVLERF